MNRWHPFFQLLLARLREFYREPEVIFWVYGFPVLLAVGLGIAFWNSEPAPIEIDVAGPAEQTEVAVLVEQLRGAGVKVEVHSEEECRERLRTGKSAFCIVAAPDGYRYVYDPTRPEAVAARHQIDGIVQRWKSDKDPFPAADDLVRDPGNRYIDFLMPGLMGMNLMGGGLWGVGFVLVDLRVRKLLKRLLATPMRRGDFLLAILTSRIMFMIPEMLLLVLVGRLGFGVPLRCDWLTLIVVILVGSFAFSGLGLFVACRAQKTETVSGLMNLVMLPMWLLSGTFFSSSRFPEVTQPFIQALPLTQLNNALREVMLEGLSLPQVGWRLGILAAYAVVCFYLALKWFRWQ